MGGTLYTMVCGSVTGTPQMLAISLSTQFQEDIRLIHGNSVCLFYTLFSARKSILPKPKCVLFDASGNELSGSGVSARVSAEQYAKDLIGLKTLLKELYKNSRMRPLLVAPGGFFDQKWYTQLLQASGQGVVNALTHHIYNLGPGECRNLHKM